MLKFFKLFLILWLLKTKTFINSESASQFDARIVGGYRSNDHKLAKYAVSVRQGRQTKFFGDNHSCGGQIYNSRIIITAAHCLVEANGEPIDASKFKIVAGILKRLDISDSMQIRVAAKTVIHPEFYTEKFADIGLIILEEALIEDNKTVQRVPLNDHVPEIGWNCTAYGWGSIFYHGPSTNAITYGNVTIISNSKCHQFLKRYQPTIYELCAVDSTGEGIDACQGDSGGPLVCNGEKLTGIISLGMGCGMPHIPGMYTNIYQFRDWIKKSCAAYYTKSLFLPCLITFYCIYWTFKLK